MTEDLAIVTDMSTLLNSIFKVHVLYINGWNKKHVKYYWFPEMTGISYK